MPIPEYIRLIRQKIGHDLLYMPGVVAVINNDEGETLLQRRSDNGLWSLVGGILEPGEEPANAIAREVWEETAMRVIPEQIVGVYAEPDALVRYPNGDEMMFLTVVFACRPVEGTPRIADDESTDVRYFRPDALPDHIDPRHKRYLLQGLKRLSNTDFVFDWAPSGRE